MSSTKIGVVVSVGNAHIRRYIYPDDDAELDHPDHVMPGEIVIRIDRGPYSDHAALQAVVKDAIQHTLGKSPGDPRCCVVDSDNIVIDFVMADPELDKHPAGHSLVLSCASIPLGSIYDPVSGLFSLP